MWLPPRLLNLILGVAAPINDSGNFTTVLNEAVITTVLNEAVIPVRKKGPIQCCALDLLSQINNVMRCFVVVARALALGHAHSLMLTEDGSVWATGLNLYGQLGDGSTTTRRTFTKVISSDAQAVAAGLYHSLVLKRDGSIWATGFNFFGQLGDGSGLDKSSFVQVIASGGKAMSAGNDHSIVLSLDGTVWATG